MVRFPSPRTCSQTNTGPADFLRHLRDTRRPVQPVFQTALYADGGFGVLGRVLERLTGLKYNDAIQCVLGKPLGLNNTGSIKPAAEDLNAVVIPGSAEKTAWGYDNQITAP